MLAVGVGAGRRGAGRDEHGLVLTTGVLTIYLRRVQDGAERRVLGRAQVASAHGERVGAPPSWRGRRLWPGRWPH